MQLEGEVSPRPATPALRSTALPWRALPSPPGPAKRAGARPQAGPGRGLGGPLSRLSPVPIAPAPGSRTKEPAASGCPGREDAQGEVRPPPCGVGPDRAAHSPRSDPALEAGGGRSSGPSRLCPRRGLARPGREEPGLRSEPSGKGRRVRRRERGASVDRAGLWRGPRLCARRPAGGHLCAGRVRGPPSLPPPAVPARDPVKVRPPLAARALGSATPLHAPPLWQPRTFFKTEV